MRNTGKLCFATLQDGDGTQVQAMLSLAEVGEQGLAPGPGLALVRERAHPGHAQAHGEGDELLLGVSELGDALADDLRDLGQLIGPEDQEAEEEDEKKLGSETPSRR